MDLVIHEALLNQLAAQIERVRPELLGVHTRRYKSRIPFPWNANKSAPPIALSNLGAEVDYEGRGSRAAFRTTVGVLTLAVHLDARVLRTAKDGGETESPFSELIELSTTFGDAQGDKYPLLVVDAALTQLNPVGLRNLLSWIIANAIAGSIAIGVPVSISISKKLTLKLSKPSIAPGAIRITASI
jgi:hypothetical protein